METIAPIEDLAQIATRWQDTMLSLEKEYEQEPEVLKIGGVPIVENIKSIDPLL